MRTFIAFILAALVILSTGSAAQVPGQSVNMVSGTVWPGGDPFLQRQNEPSLAVSTRNPLHLLAGDNDYRTVDLNLVDQLPIDELAGDAWLGVFKSFDGGRTWKSTLLPGFLQDQSSFGASSPMKGFTAASDPLVRAGTNGMFYYSGIAFNRSNDLGGLFLARFIDLNNRENGDGSQPNYPQPSKDPIRYINTVQLDSGTAGQFIDKPWMATDIPRPGAGTCNISVQQANGTTVAQSFPAGNIYVTYAMFVGGQVNLRSKIKFMKSSDCGATWTNPIMISQTYALNQGAAVAVDPETGYVYVAWRVFAGAGKPDSIVVAMSTDGGSTFTKGTMVITLPPYSSTNPSTTPAFFDQGTTGTAFRTSAVPTIAVDDSGSSSVPGRVYVAWSQRGMGPNGDARVVLSTSADGISWSAPEAVDNAAITDDFTGSFARGHQIMPAMTFNQGKLMLLYYDLRLDHSVGYFAPNTLLGVFNNSVCSTVNQGANAFVPDCQGRFYLEERDLVALSDNVPVFGPYIDDAGLTVRRHTMDVMLAQSGGGSNPTFTTARVSRYDFGLPSGKVSQNELEQLKVDPPNLPMFSQGTVPFMGDYLDIAGQDFVPVPSSSTWAYNNPNNSALTGQSAPSPVHFATWTSNQDVVPPADGNWGKYIPITNGTSIYNGTATTLCTPGVNNGWEGDRNQNIYESRITQGLLVSSPQNSKPLSTQVQRAFVVLVQNSTNFQKTFLLTIANQPPGDFSITGQGTGGYASFQQAVPNQPALPSPLPTPVTTKSVTIPPHSGAAATVFTLSTLSSATIIVNANETDTNNNLLANGLSSFIVLNADGTVPPLADPDGAPLSVAGVELYTPNITTPNITTPNITTPNITTPNITTPNITTPNITTPNITTPNITTPNITTTTVANPNITTPNITTPNITTTPVSDATYTFTNSGNTTAQYHVRVVGNTSTPLQLIASQIYTTPTSFNCQLIPQQQNIPLASAGNITTTPLGQVGNPNITTPGTDLTIEVAPGDTAYITLRGDVDIPTMQQIVTQVAPVVVPQAVNTNSTATTPPFAAPLFITMATLADAVVGSSYSVTLQTIGGVLPFAWSIESGTLPPGFALDPATGTISNTNSELNVAGTYSFTVDVTDSAGSRARKQLTIRVFAPLVITTVTLPDGIVGLSYPVILQAVGGTGTYTWNGAAPAGLTLNPNGTFSGTPAAAGTITFPVVVTDSASPPQVATRALSLTTRPGETLVNIPAASGGDLISRGFYMPSYPGIALTTAYLYLGADTAGTYTFTLTAYSGGFGGNPLGSAIATANLSGGRFNQLPVAFSFSPSLAIVPGATVAFAINEVSGPGPATQVFYSVGSCGLGDTTCSVPGPQVIETEGTTPPLDTFRRNAISLLLIEGSIGASGGTAPTKVLFAPNSSAWLSYTPDHSFAGITNANPRSGTGSVELSKLLGNGSALVGLGPLLGLGTYGNLNQLSFDWYIDPASSSALPPQLALRIYPYGDPRTFFVYWNTCSPECTAFPTGSWQTTNLMGQLSLQVALDNPNVVLPASLASIPPDAPVSTIDLRASYSFGTPWHGFVDNVTIGFTPQNPVTFNFEFPPCMTNPLGLLPFASIRSETQDTAADTFLVGSLFETGISQISAQVPLPSAPNQQFCSPLTLESNYSVPSYVPTASERTGDFSGYSSLGLVLTDPTTGGAIPNDIIPAPSLGAVYGWRIPPHNPFLPKLDCSLESGLKSVEGTVPTSIQFVNESPGAISIDWLDYNGQRVFYNSLAPGQAYTQLTWLTHPWIALDAQGTCHGIWLPIETVGGVVVH